MLMVASTLTVHYSQHGDPGLWPMTLTFKVDHDTIHVHLLVTLCHEKATNQNSWKQYFWPGDPDLWPMTLTYKVDPDTILVHLHTKFCGPSMFCSAVRVLRVMWVGVLKKPLVYWKTKKQTNNQPNMVHLKKASGTGLIIALELPCSIAADHPDNTGKVSMAKHPELLMLTLPVLSADPRRCYRAVNEYSQIFRCEMPWKQ